MRFRPGFRFVTAPALAAAAFLMILAAPTRASAQTTYGVRVGASANPDQFVFGGHVETPPLVDRLHFRPNVGIGVGDDTTLVALNFEFAYKFASRTPWHVYAGGGPALNIYSGDRRDDAEGGFNLLLGVEHQKGLFAEVKVGTIDSPDFTIAVGYVFH
jgi:hypothetical protein